MTDKTCNCDQSEDKAINQYEKALHTHFIAQWITSLAISVVCCAILFVVFAGYIVKIQEKSNISEVRLEVLNERVTEMQSKLTQLTRAPLVQINSPTAPQVSTQQGDQPATSEKGEDKVSTETTEPQTQGESGISLTPSDEKAALAKQDSAPIKTDSSSIKQRPLVKQIEPPTSHPIVLQ